MGGFLTKEQDSPMPYEDTTPPREVGIPKRQLPFDPRSPTDNFVRTPIIVDSAPSELAVLDPRSPTYGIERTPITVVLGKDWPTQYPMEVEEESKSQPVPPVSTTPLCEPEDTDMTTPQKPPSPLDSQPVESSIPDTNTKDASPLLENTEQPAVSVAEHTPSQPKMASLPGKKLFPTTQLAPETLKQAPLFRALGLVARDTNSPRDIVQTKQRRQVTKSMGGVRGHAVVDKENLAH